jgi:hypothetical protein
LKEKKEFGGFRRLGAVNWDKSGVCMSGCTEYVPGLARRYLSATTTSETLASNNVNEFLKSIAHKYPVIEWTPRLDANGNPVEMLVVHNQYLIKNDDGQDIVQDVYLSDKQLNQDGPTKIFTPMPNSVNVEWAWVNLKERPPQPIDFKLKMMTLPEINSVNNFLEMQQDNAKEEMTVAGGQIVGKTSSSSIGAFFEPLMFALMFCFLALVGINVLDNYGSAA